MQLPHWPIHDHYKTHTQFFIHPFLFQYTPTLFSLPSFIFFSCNKHGLILDLEREKNKNTKKKKKKKNKQTSFFFLHADMKNNQTKPPILKYFFLSLFLFLPFFLFIFSLKPKHHQNTTTADPTSKAQIHSAGDLKIRPGYASYESYIQRQLHKTLNPKLRQVWTTRDWDRKIQVFVQFFQDLKRKELLFNESKALSIGARVGQEVEALRRVGVSDSVGIDLVPYPPLVIKGDFHSQPFGNETFDFEFSNVFDHALYPDKFVGEIERTLKPNGVCVLHVALSRRSDKYSANDLYSVEPLVEMFKVSEVVHVRKVDGFGLDTEVVFRKKTVI